MQLPDFLIIIISVSFLAATINALWYRRKYITLVREQIKLDEKRKSLETRYVNLKDSIKQNQTFSEKLKEISPHTSKLQMSRSSYQSQAASSSIPERYGWVAALAEKGAEAQEVAQSISVSRHEAEQLIKLSRLGHV